MNSHDGERGSPIDLSCEACRLAAYDTQDPVLRRKLVVALGHSFSPKTGFTCRRCHLVSFAVQVERWIEDPWEVRGNMTPEEYALVFESKVKELHQVVVNG